MDGGLRWVVMAEWWEVDDGWLEETGGCLGVGSREQNADGR